MDIEYFDIVEKKAHQMKMEVESFIDVQVSNIKVLNGFEEKLKGEQNNE